MEIPDSYIAFLKSITVGVQVTGFNPVVSHSKIAWERVICSVYFLKTAESDIEASLKFDKKFVCEQNDQKYRECKLKVMMSSSGTKLLLVPADDIFRKKLLQFMFCRQPRKMSTAIMMT